MPTLAPPLAPSTTPRWAVYAHALTIHHAPRAVYAHAPLLHPLHPPIYAHARTSPHSIHCAPPGSLCPRSHLTPCTIHRAIYAHAHTMHLHSHPIPPSVHIHTPCTHAPYTVRVRAPAIHT